MAQAVPREETAEIGGLGWPAGVADRALLDDYEDDEPEARASTERTSLLGDPSAAADGRPWYRRPSPWWLLPGSMLMAICMGSTMAPKIEIYSLLVCRQLGTAQQLPVFRPPTTVATLAAPTLQTPVDRFAAFLDAAATPSPATIEDGTGGLDPKLCRSNTKVQRAVAQLIVTLGLAMGILSSLTTSYWGGYSDRSGRVRVIAIALTGFVISDVVFITVVHNYQRLDYRWLVIAPTLDGLLGGYATASAAFGAYVSDATPGGSRARIFSILSGAMFLAIAAGPTLGTLVVRIGGTPLAPFYSSASISFVNILFTLTILPESLSKERRLVAQEKWEALRKSASEAGPQALRARVRGWFAFLQPITMFYPRRTVVEDDVPAGAPIEEEDRTALTSGRALGKRDWTLFRIAIAYAMYMSVMGLYSVKMQYSQYRFGWGPEENAKLLTLVGMSRVLFLVILLPLGIKLFKRHAPSLAGTTAGREESVHRLNRRARMLYDAHFDVVLARLSLLVDLCSFLVLTFIETPIAFLIGTAAMSLGAGASPALQSLALSLSSPTDAGKVMAGFGVLQSVMASIGGPLIYGSIFAITIDVFPTAMFAFGALSFVVAFVSLTMVRFPSRTLHTRQSFSIIEEHAAEAARRSAKRRGRSERPSSKVFNDSGVSVSTTAA